MAARGAAKMEGGSQVVVVGDQLRRRWGQIWASHGRIRRPNWCLGGGGRCAHGGGRRRTGRRSTMCREGRGDGGPRPGDGDGRFWRPLARSAAWMTMVSCQCEVGASVASPAREWLREVKSELIYWGAMKLGNDNTLQFSRERHLQFQEDETTLQFVHYNTKLIGVYVSIVQENRWTREWA
ncbi:hypothetical protein OsI_13259 [Oryza sativa Indica Group]|uniref:Uncharacterized protein n=1 Tax=Oryza sativa subsp. indica TaxID=39946 RepID=A2XLB4_ORYSI|nr:hypothetical protein OsI_13259 [Oryza sativa Indica Group]